MQNQENQLNQKDHLELDELPSSDDEFWSGAKVEKREMVHNKCDHFFVGTHEVECVKCHAGFRLSNDFYIRNGKMYYMGEIVF